MTHTYKCSKCNHYTNVKIRHFNPAKEIQCKCGNTAKKIFTPTTSIFNKMNDRTVKKSV